MFRSTLLRLSVFASAFLLSTLALYAQGGGNQGVIAGSVSDPSGALVSTAAVSAINNANGTSFTARTGSDGRFIFPVVPAGVYTLTVKSQGFAEYKDTHLTLNVGAKLDIPIQLAISGSEVLNVTAEAPVVETDRTQLSSVVNDRAVQNLPTNGRNFLDFVLLTPGVTRDVRGGDLSFAGQRGTLNSLTIDGTDNNNSFFGQTLGRTGSGRAPYQFSQDAVQEFQVNTNGYSAELGRAGGAVVNVITKSGTNSFHGTAFEFYRDRALNANDPIYNIQVANARNAGRPIPAKPQYHFNQFGGNFGGPVIKNKLFFFFDYDGQRNLTGNAVLVTFPTPTTPAQTAAINYLQPRSQNYGRTFNQNVYLGKADYNISQNHVLSARYNAQRFTGQALENSGSTSAFEHTGASLVNTDSINAQLTSTLRPNLVNVAKFSYQRDNEPGQANSINPEANVQNNGQTLLFVGRNSFSPRETTIHRQQYGDILTVVAGQHTFKFGADALVDKILNFFPGNFSGAYTFNSLENFGRSLLGQPLAPGTEAGNRLVEAFPGAGTTGPQTNPDALQVAGFLQDDWKIASNLTLNLGIRYDVQLVKQPGVRNPAAFAAGIDTATINNDLNNVAPRLGFAWTPFKSNQFVLRGGYGVFYGNTPSIMYGTADSNNGINVQTITFNASATNQLPSYPKNACGAPQAVAGCPLPAGAVLTPPTIFAFQSNYQQPYVQQYNLNTEFELVKDLSMTIGYLGVHGVKLQRTNDVNLPVVETPTNILVPATGQVLTYQKFTGARPIAAFSRVLQFQSTAGSNYNGLIVQLNKRFSQNYQMLVSYTWSRAIDDSPDATAVVPGTDDAKMAYDPSHTALEHAVSSNDVPNRFVISGIWQLNNYARGLSNPFAKGVFGGWELAGIFTAQSGQPYTAKVNTDLNGDGNISSERVPGFARNTFRMPAIYSLDPRITKNFPIYENVRVQLIGEAFNVFNHSNITGVRTTLFNVVNGTLVRQSIPTAGINAFGVPTSANINGQGNVGRVLQLAAKIVF